MWIVVAIHGHVDDFCQEVAGNDSWIDSHNFNGDILSHFLWRLNSSPDLIVSAAAGLNA